MVVNHWFSHGCCCCCDLVVVEQNHRGAMMELGEGLCKLRKMGFENGPFLRFEEILLALEFLYRTQKELVACELCC